MYCKHYISGCREMFAQAEDLDYHQNGCIYQQLFCPYLDCYSLFCEFQIDEHLKKEHLEAFEASKELITVEYHENMKCLIDLSADDCIFNTIIPILELITWSWNSITVVAQQGFNHVFKQFTSHCKCSSHFSCQAYKN